MYHFHDASHGFTKRGSLGANIFVHGALLQTSQQAQDGGARAKISHLGLHVRSGPPSDGASGQSLRHPRDTPCRTVSRHSPHPHAWLCATSLSSLPSAHGGPSSPSLPLGGVQLTHRLFQQRNKTFKCHSFKVDSCVLTLPSVQNCFV